MEENEPMKAVLSITIDGALNVGISYGGREELLLGMLGALRYADDWVIERLRSRQDVGGVWSREKLREQAAPTYTAERKVPRDEAISAYEYAREALRLRIEALSKCSIEQEFAINPDFLSQL